MRIPINTHVLNRIKRQESGSKKNKFEIEHPKSEIKEGGLIQPYAFYVYILKASKFLSTSPRNS